MDRQVQDYLDRVHDADFEMLCEVDRICKMHGINYYLHGGTFLGAIRHQDFIPWDDDVDILFLRKDYERFIEVFEKEADERFKLHPFERYPQFFDFISKIADTSITYEKTSYGAEEFYENRYSHPTLDLFVFDVEAERHKWQLLRLQLLYSLAMGHRPYVDYSKFKGIMKIAAWILPHIGAFIPFKKIAQMYKKVQVEGGIAKVEEASLRDENNDVRRMLFISNEQQNPKYWGLDFDAEHLVLGHDTAFIRGKEFPIPKMHDRWLSKTYGDYMSLPPKEEQVPMHVNIIAR